MKAAHQPRCMVCGPENPQSWNATFVIEAENRIRGSIVFDERHEGAPGYVHGGAVAAMLDDALGSVLLAIKTPAVTANLTVDYRKPIFLGRELTAEAWCDHVDGRKIHLAGRLLDGDTVLAETTALFIEVPLERFHPDGANEWFYPPN
jgi:uncharacterized protein (TIGR00369 family)